MIFFDGWQHAAYVEVNATQKDFVRAHFRRDDSQLLQLVVDKRVDVVEFRRLGIGVLQTLRKRDELSPDRVSLEASHDE